MVLAGACGARAEVDVAVAAPVPLALAAPTTTSTLPPAPPAVPVAVDVGPSQASVEQPFAASSRVVSVVIGIDDYIAEPDLLFAEEDAGTVIEALDIVDGRGRDRITLLGRDATADAIRESLRWLAATAGPGDIAVLAYAGHAELLDDGRQAIVSTDGVRIADSELASLLGAMPARTWLLFATCFGGGFDELLAPGRILTAAAGPTEETFEYQSVGRTYLVEHAIRRGWLQGRAGSSVQEAIAFASAEIRQARPDEMPFVDDRTGDLLVLGPIGAPFITPPADLVPPPPGPGTPPLSADPRPAPASDESSAGASSTPTCRRVGVVEMCE